MCVFIGDEGRATGGNLEPTVVPLAAQFLGGIGVHGVVG